MARVLHLDVNYLEGTVPVRMLWSIYFMFIYYPILAGGIAIRRRLGYNVVTDRYVYDLIVGFWGVRKRVPLEHLLIWLLPHPDLSFVFSADEDRILADRPEHSIEFIRNEMQIYDSLAAQFRLTKISTRESKQIVWQQVAESIEQCMSEVPQQEKEIAILVNN